jgi:hypothetical protein
LDGTELEWVKQMLFVFNAGDIGKYEALVPRLPQLVSLDMTSSRQGHCFADGHAHTKLSSPS